MPASLIAATPGNLTQQTTAGSARASRAALRFLIDGKDDQMSVLLQRERASTGRFRTRKPATPPRRGRRRRPGQLPSLWRVEGRDRVTNQPRAIGYLITSGTIVPDPIAFVPLLGPRAVRMAAEIRDDHRKAEKLACRLDNMRNWRESLDLFMGMMLIPIDSRGRDQCIDGFYAAAQFIPAFHWHGIEFRRIASAELAAIRRKLSSSPIAPMIFTPKICSPENESGNETSGSSAQPDTLTPASKKSDRAAKLKAA